MMNINWKEVCDKIDCYNDLMENDYGYAESNPLEAIECAVNNGCMIDFDNMVYLKELLGIDISYDLYSFIDKHYDGGLMELDKSDLPYLKWLINDYIRNKNHISSDELWCGYDFEKHEDKYGFCGWHERVIKGIEKDMKMVSVCIYADTTGLFSEAECNRNNLVDMYFPLWVIKEWYDTDEDGFKFETADELDKSLEECTFEDWFNNVYTAEDTDGLYDFAIQNGVKPIFYVDYHTYVYCRDEDGYIIIVFTGSYNDCREFCKKLNWEINGNELEVAEYK